MASGAAAAGNAAVGDTLPGDVLYVATTGEGKTVVWQRRSIWSGESSW
jgi:hypothetical protein